MLGSGDDGRGAQLTDNRAKGVEAPAVEDDIVNAYRTILGRRPENEQVVLSRLGERRSDLFRAFLGAAEFVDGVARPNLRGEGTPHRFREPLDEAVRRWAVQAFDLSGPVAERILASRDWRSFGAALFSDPSLESYRGPSDVRLADLAAALAKPRQDAATLVGALIARGSRLAAVTWLGRYGWHREDGIGGLLDLAQDGAFVLSPVFDPHWYALQAGLPPPWNLFTALADYVQRGERIGLSPNPFFSPGLHLATNPAAAERLRVGAVTSVLDAFDDPRQPRGPFHDLFFDDAYYAEQGPTLVDGAEAGALGHYVRQGWREGRRPNRWFDEDWYLATHASAREAVAFGRYPNGFSHLVHEGYRAGVKISPFFDADAYVERHPDASESLLKKTVPSAFAHYWTVGRPQHRNADLASLSPLVTRHFYKAWPLGADREALVGARSADASDAVAGVLFEKGRPQIGLEHGREQTLFKGQDYRIYVSGFARWPYAQLTGVSHAHDEADGFFSYARVDDAEAVAAVSASPLDLESGFVAWFDLDLSGVAPGRVSLPLSFTFRQGDALRTVVGPTVEIDLQPAPARSTSDAPVQVAMAAYNAGRASIGRQVASILAQDGPPPTLVIADDGSRPDCAANVAELAADPRVTASYAPANGGFVVNFERALLMLSPSAHTVLLSDHDDDWYPHKAQTLAAALAGPDVALAFSDQRIVDAEGRVLSETFWAGRSVHYGDPLALAMANAVTGAACALPASVLKDALPFPRYMGLYHDQWLSVFAAAFGRIAYVDQPLYDYIQHGENVLGFAGSRGVDAAKWRWILRQLRAAGRVNAADSLDDRQIGLIRLALGLYPALIQRYVLLSEALRRLPVWRNWRDRELAARFCRLIEGGHDDALALKRLWRARRRAAGGDAALLGIDSTLEAVLTAVALLRRVPGVVDRLAGHQRATRASTLTQTAAWGRKDAGTYEKKTAPLTVVPSSRTELRVNLLLPELRMATFFGGYYSKLALARRLLDRGVAVRIVMLDQPTPDWKELVDIGGANPELLPVLSKASFVAVGGRDAPLELGPGDALLATTWWSAHVADDLRRRLGRARFTYLVQEFEPFTFPLGTLYRAAELSYALPHDPVYSTQPLADFFADADLVQNGAEPLVFDNPIVGLDGLARLDPTSRPRRLLFYARPQEHMTRNMYEFGLAALKTAAARLGPALDGWDLVGVGADKPAEVALGAGRSLRLISKLSPAAYRRMLAGSDVGLALMYTPHPSLVPIEMAAAGLVTVTNTCLSKTAETMATISPDLISAEPTVEALADALVEAVSRATRGDVGRGPVQWPSSPEAAFPDAWMAQFEARLRRSLEPA